MSWQDYVDTQLINFGGINNANEAGAIISLAGQPWAYSSNFQLKEYEIEIEITDTEKKKIKVNEIANLIDALANKGKCSKEGGIRMNGEKYMIGKADPEAGLYYLGKTPGGACIAKTNQAYVICTYNKSAKNANGELQTPYICNTACENLAKFLIDSNL